MANNIQKFLQKESYPPLIVFNRTASRADEIKDSHVKVADTLEAAVGPADIIFTCVTSESFPTDWPS
jgi:3-hydroxyisobutyrate dehydrogenase-like beta-hydroxyacid dehydrogenase